MLRNLKLFALIAAAAAGSIQGSAQDSPLTGDLIVADGQESTTLSNAFDGDLSSTFFANKGEGYSRPWVGLDLGEKHVITKIGFAPAQTSSSCSRLAIFQGANSADFIDAMPIAMVPIVGPRPGEMYEMEVNVSRGFRYVRMVCAGGAQMNVAEIAFYGTPGEGDDSQFFQITDLPTIAFNTPNMAEIRSKDDKHPGSTIYVISEGGTSLLTDNNCQMKGRGNGSWEMEKKPFQIRFDKKQKILPNARSKAKKWTLINNHGDKTLMRNRVAFDISEVIGMPYTPYCQFVDVVYNGEYEGCYQLCDQVEVCEGRVEITEMTPDDISGEALTGGYFLEIDAYANQEKSWFTANYGIPVTIKSPDEDEIEPRQREYIESYFNRMISALFSYNFDDELVGYRAWLDLDSFLKYFLHGELTGNTDTFWSTYITKERGAERFVVGPVWDQDLAFDNDNRTYPINDKPDFIYNYGSRASGMDWFVDRIIVDDTKARYRLSEIWSTLRKLENFNAEYFNARIDEYAAQLDASQQLNFMRWPILMSYIHQNPILRGTYSSEVKALKDYITRRFTKLDQMIGIVDVPDAIEDVTADDSNAPVQWYGIDGTPRDASDLQPGIYIKRQGTHVQKVAVE